MKKKEDGIRPFFYFLSFFSLSPTSLFKTAKFWLDAVYQIMWLAFGVAMPSSVDFFFQNLILKLWRCIPTQVSRLATTVFTSGRMSCRLPTLPSPESSEEHEVELRRSSLQAYSLAAFSPIATIFGERAADVLRILLGCFIDRFIKL